MADSIFFGGQVSQANPTGPLSANVSDSRVAGGQVMPASAPYGSRQGVTSLIYQADGAPYRTSGRFSIKGDDRTYVDIHNLNPYAQVLYTYEGSHGYRDNSYLIYFPREEWYQERQKYSLRSVVAFRSVVDAMVQPVFEKEILRQSNNDLFNIFIENADNTGTCLQDVNETAQTHARMLGLTFIIMDNFSDAEKVGTVKDAVDGRKFPYVYEKMPHEVFKWKCNNWGKLEWITFYDKQEMVEDSSTRGKVSLRQYYRRWENYNSILYYEEIDKSDRNKTIEVIVSKARHGLNYLPVYPILDYAKCNNLSKFPSPLLADIANMAFILYNIESWIMLLDVYCFPILTIPTMDGSQLALSVTNAIEVPNEAKHTPQFISPPTDCLDVLLRGADRLEEKIYKAANQLGVSGSARKGVATISGISKEWDFRASNSLLTKTAFSSKKLEEWCAKTFGDYIYTGVTYSVDFPSEFVEAYSMQRIQRGMDLLKELPPENLAKEIWKEIAKIYFDDDPDKAQTICDGIDNGYAQKMQDSLNMQSQEGNNINDNKGNQEGESGGKESGDFKSMINGILAKFGNKQPTKAA